MKLKLIILALFVFAFGNVRSQIYTQENIFGKTMNRLEILYNLAVPQDTIPPPVAKQGKVHLVILPNGSMWYWSPSTLKYEALSGGGGGGTYFAGYGLDLSSSIFTVDTSNEVVSKSHLFGMPAYGISNGMMTGWNAKLDPTDLSANAPLFYNSGTGVFTLDTANATYGVSTKARLMKVIDSVLAGLVVSETDPVWTAASTNYYTKTNLQTSGQAVIHYSNINSPPWLTSYTETDPIFSASPAAGVTAPLISNWNNAFTDRMKWDGGSTGLVAATGRTSLGGTTVGQNIFTATNPSAVTWIRVNADNTVTFRTSAQLASDIGAITTETDPTAVHLTGVETIFGAKTFNSSVTSVGGFFGTSFYGSYTGSIATPAASTGVYYFKTDGLPYAKNAAGTEMPLFNAGGGGSVTSLSVVTANGFAGTVADPTTTPAITLTTSQTGVLVGNGTSMTGVAGTANQLLRRNAGNTAYEFFTPTYLTSYTETDPLALKIASNLSDLANAGTARTNLGGTTVGQNLFTLTNPSAVRWIRINADNTISVRTAAETLSDIGAQAAGSYVNTISGGTTGLTPSSATSGAVTLAGTLDVDNGGTGATTLTGVVIGNGTSTMTGVAGTANQLLRRNAGNTAYEFFTPTYLTAANLTLGTATASTLPVNIDAGTDVTLPVFSTTAGLVPGTTSSTTNFLRADGTWAVPAGGSVGTLQQVTTAGNTTNLAVRSSVNFSIHDGSFATEYAAIAVSGTTGGMLRLKDEGSANRVYLWPNTLTAQRNQRLPNADGTVALQEWVTAQGYSTGVVEPANQIVVGTGSGVDSYSDLYYNNSTKVFAIAGGGAGNTPVQISRTSTGVNQFLTMTDAATSSGMEFGGLSSSGFLPAITFRPDKTVQNSAYFLTYTADAGSSAGFIIDSRLVAGPLTTQDIFAVQTYGNEKFKVKANGTLWLDAVVQDDTKDMLLTYDPSTKLVNRRAVSSISGSSYTFTTSDFDVAGSTVSLDATFKAQHDFLYGESFKSKYILNSGTAGFYRQVWTQNDSVLIEKGLRIELNNVAVTADTTTTDITWDLAVQTPITLTTTGTSGAATFTGGVLNIPQYSGGGGGGSPYGLDGWLQFGYGGNFRATPKFRFDSTNNRLLYNINSRFSSDDFVTYVDMWSENGAYKIKSGFGGTAAVAGIVTFNNDVLLKNYIAGQFKIQTNDGDDEVIIDPAFVQFTSLDTDGSSPSQTGTIMMATVDGTGKFGFQAIPSGGGGINNQLTSAQTYQYWITGEARTDDDFHSLGGFRVRNGTWAAADIVDIFNDGGAGEIMLTNDANGAFAQVSGDGTIFSTVSVESNRLIAPLIDVKNATNKTTITAAAGADYSQTLPAGNGALALFSQIPTNNSSLTNDAGYLTATSTNTLSNKTIDHDVNTIVDMPKETSIAIENPTASHQLRMFRAGANGATAVEGNVALRGTSPSVTYAIHYGTTYGTSQGTIVASNTVTTAPISTMTLNTTAIPANAYVWLTVTATSGTVLEFAPILKWKQ